MIIYISMVPIGIYSSSWFCTPKFKNPMIDGGALELITATKENDLIKSF